MQKNITCSQSGCSMFQLTLAMLEDRIFLFQDGLNRWRILRAPRYGTARCPRPFYSGVPTRKLTSVDHMSNHRPPHTRKQKNTCFPRVRFEASSTESESEPRRSYLASRSRRAPQSSSSLLGRQRCDCAKISVHRSVRMYLRLCSHCSCKYQQQQLHRKALNQNSLQN